MARTDTRSYPRRFTLGLTLLVAVAIARSASADTLTLMWDFNTEPVNGYRVYIGTRPGVYVQNVDVHNVNTYVFDSAAPGQRYYFAVAAYAGNLVGPLSVEVSGVARNTVSTATNLPHASPDVVYTGTAAAVRPPAAPAGSTRTTVRSPAGQSAGTGASVYTGRVGVTRSVDGGQESSSPAPRTGTSAMSRPVSSDGRGTGGLVIASGALIRSAARDTSDTGALAEGSDEVPAPDAEPRVAIPASGAPRQTAVSAPMSGPAVSIETPVNQATLPAGSPVIFSGTAPDVVDGSLSARIVWTSSVDGYLGTGALVTKALSPGTHIIRASVTNGRGTTRTAQVAVVVR